MEPTKETLPYWQALKDGHLTAQRCSACKVVRAYPRRFCPHCGAEEAEWIDAGQEGYVYSFSVVRRAPQGFHLPAPYLVALVDLPIGIRMLTNIVGEPSPRIAIGDTVRLTIMPFGDFGLPCFVPIDGPVGRE
jgi:uncharacterized OB-fold protein